MSTINDQCRGTSFLVSSNKDTDTLADDTCSRYLSQQSFRAFYRVIIALPWKSAGLPRSDICVIRQYEFVETKSKLGETVHFAMVTRTRYAKSEVAFTSSKIIAAEHKKLSPIQYRGFRARMVYLDYITCLRYTILVRNPRNHGVV